MYVIVASLKPIATYIMLYIVHVHEISSTLYNCALTCVLLKSLMLEGDEGTNDLRPKSERLLMSVFNLLLADTGAEEGGLVKPVAILCAFSNKVSGALMVGTWLASFEPLLLRSLVCRRCC